MSDFILSNQKQEESISSLCFEKVFNGIYEEVLEFQGSWGFLTIPKNHYDGFNTFEDEQFLIGVIGGPVLTFKKNNFDIDSDNEHTREIFERWKSGKIVWDEDLSGPFVIIIVDKVEEKFVIVTDLMSFIPVYKLENGKLVAFSSHVDLLAKSFNIQNEIDYISIVDFIINGIVTYPYTTNLNIFQVPPSSLHLYSKRSNNINSTFYWRPYETFKFHNKKKAAKKLQLGLKKYVNSLVSKNSKVAQFISGGEDSRVLSSLLKPFPRDSFIFLEQFNLEGKKAKKAAEKNNANFYYFTRTSTHYLEIFPEVSKLCSSNFQFIHAHSYKFHLNCQLHHYDGVFGGLFADALLKGSRIAKLKGTTRPYIPDVKVKEDVTSITQSIFKDSFIEKLRSRKKKHLDNINTFRKKSSDEWFYLWPSSMNVSISNLHVNRRLFKSYEPFLSKDIVKLSASVPQSWKLNRRLFHKASKDYLRSTKFLIHSDGRLPYFSWYINIPISFSNVVFKKVLGKLGLQKGEQGPWYDKNKLVNSSEFSFLYETYYYKSIIDFNYLSTDNLDGFSILESLSPNQKFNLIQTLYLFSES
ncbi:hypothetical protein [Halobacillus sp. K22]|uniref:hypothetical protein n=1 Tax=Halobacillus sp. K22 TaxID=3457431 RepID=UPI003FCE379C